MLERIHGPADLRGLSYEELDDLALEIREFVVAPSTSWAAATSGPTSASSS